MERVAEADCLRAGGGTQRPHGAHGAAVTPGFMRTEAIPRASACTEATWRRCDRACRRRRASGGRIRDAVFHRRAASQRAGRPIRPLTRRRRRVCLDRGRSPTECGFADIDGARPRLGAATRNAFSAYLSPGPSPTPFEMAPRSPPQAPRQRRIRRCDCRGSAMTAARRTGCIRVPAPRAAPGRGALPRALAEAGALSSTCTGRSAQADPIAVPRRS